VPEFDKSLHLEGLEGFCAENRPADAVLFRVMKLKLQKGVRILYVPTDFLTKGGKSNQ